MFEILWGSKLLKIEKTEVGNMNAMNSVGHGQVGFSHNLSYVVIF